MTKKEKKEYTAYVEDLSRSLRQWPSLNEKGGSDPYWTDGCNMNLTRNHIIYSKRRLKEFCAEHEILLPVIAMACIPPVVAENYMCLTPFIGTEMFIKRVQSQSIKVFSYKKAKYKKFKLKVR